MANNPQLENLQVLEPRRTYRLTHRLKPTARGIFVVPSLLDLTFIRFDRLTLVNKFARRHFGSTRTVATDSIITDTAWTEENVIEDLLERGFRRGTVGDTNGITDPSNYYVDVNLYRAVTFADTEFYTDLNINGKNPRRLNPITISPKRDFPRFKLFSLEMTRPQTGFQGQQVYKIADFTVGQSDSIVTISTDTFAVNDIPIRNDGLPLELRIRDVVKDYYLSAKQMGENSICEVTLSGGV